MSIMRGRAWAWAYRIASLISLAAGIGCLINADAEGAGGFIALCIIGGHLADHAGGDR